MSAATWERDALGDGEYEINEVDPWGRREYIATIMRSRGSWLIFDDGGRIAKRSTLAKATAWVVANRVAEALR